MYKFYRRILLLGCISTLPLLYFYYQYNRRQAKMSYDFVRNIIYDIPTMQRIDLHYNSYYFSGTYRGKIYLGNYTRAGTLLCIDSLLRKTDTIRLQLPKSNLANQGYYKIKLDSGLLSLANGAARSAFIGQIDQDMKISTPFPSPYFQDLCRIGQNTIAFRYVSTLTGHNSLRKVSLSGQTTENDTVLEKQVDGLFCTAGMLTYHREIHQISYTYYYRNEILLLDTNLNLIQKIKTIDPIDTARFKTAEISSNQTLVFTEKPLLVNANCSAWRHYLFIQSKLMGRHEDIIRFKNSSVIDVYDLKTGKYVRTVYLPNQDKKSIKQILVADQCIYALSDQHLTRYSFQKFIP